MENNWWPEGTSEQGGERGKGRLVLAPTCTRSFKGTPISAATAILLPSIAPRQLMPGHRVQAINRP